MRAIESAASEIQIEGERYTPQQMEMVGRESAQPSGQGSRG
jgi:hypothetical protein